MGRFSVDTSLKNPQQNNMQPGMMGTPSNWPTLFPKESIGIEIPGIVVEEGEILQPGDLKILDGSLNAIKELRLKGYKVFLFFNEPLISQGKLKVEDVDARLQHLMQIFGQAGILSIEGILYSTSTLKNDIYSFPNNGMLKRAEREFNQKYKGGYFLSNNLNGIKAGESAGAKPILINSLKIEEIQLKLNTFANKDLKNKIKIFNDLQSFSNFLD